MCIMCPLAGAKMSMPQPIALVKGSGPPISALFSDSAVVRRWYYTCRYARAPFCSFCLAGPLFSVPARMR